MTDIDSDVPPLEDMSEELTKRATIRQPTGIKSSKNKYASLSTSVAPRKVTESQDLLALETKTSSLKISTETLAVSKESKKTQAAAPAAEKSSDFGGLKKGFLFSSQTSPKTSKSLNAAKSTIQREGSLKTVEDIPFLKPTTQPLALPEVQAAIADQMSLLDKQEWLNQSFLDKIAATKHLAKVMNDPGFQGATADFQKDPKMALSKYSNKPEYVEALKEFASLLGSELHQLGEQAPKQPVEVPIQKRFDIPNDLPDHEKDLVRRVMSDSNIQEALRDPVVQTLLLKMHKAGSQGVEALLAAQSPAISKKIRVLIDAGLIQMRR